MSEMFNPVVEGLTVEEIRHVQEARVLRQVRRVYASNAFYRNWFERHGVRPDELNRLDDFYDRVPLLNKSDLLDDQADHPPFGQRSAGVEPITQMFFTSGTSGAAQEVHPLSAQDVEGVGTAMAYTWYWAGVRPGDRMLLTLPFGITGAGTYFYQACAELGTVPLVAGPVDTQRKLELIERLQPHVLVAPPSYLYRLSVAGREVGLDPARDVPTLRTILVNSESFGLEFATEMSAYWGATLHEWYGSTQMGGNTMGTCGSGVIGIGDHGPERGVLHNLDHRNLLEIRDPDTGSFVEPGEFGEVIVTNLHRTAFPCIRFRMKDKVRYLGTGICRCGGSFTSYESGTIARYDDMMKIRGMNVWPQSVDRLIMTGTHAEEYRATVSTSRDTGLETLTIEVEPFRTATDVSSWLQSISSRFRQEIGVSASFTVVPQGTLPRFDTKPRRWHDNRLGKREPAVEAAQ